MSGPEGQMLAEARDRELLHARALALARPAASVPAPGVLLSVIRFDLAGEPHALEIRHVLAVLPPTAMAVVPEGPPALAGLVNYRGEVLAVFDLRPVLGLPSARDGGLRRIMVVGDERDPVGLAIDGLPEVAEIRRDGLSAPGRLTLGMTASGCVVLDGEALLGDDRLVVDQGAGAGEDG